MSIAQAVFLLECGQTRTETYKEVTDTNDQSTHISAASGVNNN